MKRNRPPSPEARRVLEELASSPADWRHGYDLMKAAGVQSGTLYPLLMRWTGRGLVEARWEPPAAPGRPARHVYRLTPQGRVFAAAQGLAQTGPAPRVPVPEDGQLA